MHTKQRNRANIMSTLSILSQALVSAAPSRDKDFARAEAMYSAYFRSEPVTMDSVFSDLTYQEHLEEGVPEWFDMDGSLLVCELCNYKGEGEGRWVLFEGVKHLPVFKSKSASASYFNI
jgi:hypothetical protein